MALKHFNHRHPLMFISDAPHGKDGEENECHCCEKPILSSAYGCRDCKYFLHKKCGELPRVIKHHSHSEHPITLLHYLVLYKGYTCSLCKDVISGFGYRCSRCDFDAHVLCITLKEERLIEDKIHDHPLAFVERVSSFTCDACSTEGEDLSYRCSTCQFWIHASCASSATTIHRLDHEKHPLVLASGIPYEYQNFIHECYICKNTVQPSTWVYYCPSCRYFAHLKCAKSKEEPLMLSDTLSVENLDLDLVRVPVPGLMNLMSQFSIDTPFTDDGTTITCANSHGWSWIDDDVGRKNEMKNKEILCDVCVQPIIFSSPFSNCGKCSFIAHTRCMFLRLEILHPSHLQHPLKLFNVWSTFGLCRCDICGGYTNGYIFKCTTCDNFRIDVGCATICLPNTIKHQAHNHPLILQTNLVSTEEHHCKACSKAINYGMKYRCDSITCNFQLHTNCAMLLGAVQHDWDEHQISLTYPPFDHPDDYFCEDCEEDIHPTHWLYHCSKCDHSFHTNCVHPHDMWSKVKFGITYKFEGHEHHLTFVRKPKKSRLCDSCGRWYETIPSLDCASCSYQMCVGCATKGKSRRIELLGED